VTLERPSPVAWAVVFERLADLETELEKLERSLPELYAAGDQRAAAEAGKRIAELRPVVEAFREHQRTDADLTDARELLEQARSRRACASC